MCQHPVMGTTSAQQPASACSLPSPASTVDPSPLSSSPRKPPPPRPNDPEVVRNIEVLAPFAVKHGPQFELLAKTKKADDPTFAFIFGGSPGTEAAIGYEFYEWKKRCLKKQKFAQDGSDDVQLKICKLVEDVASKEVSGPQLKSEKNVVLKGDTGSQLISEKDFLGPLKSPSVAGVQKKKVELAADDNCVKTTRTPPHDDANRGLAQSLEGARAAEGLEAGKEEAEVREKLSKEAWGLKLLRSTLAEYVKEVLNPTWKEGHMSKDAYKTIVKKVVDKVSGTLQPHQIPKSQENVDQYMAMSRTKIAKLVQGYVEKFTKT